MARHDNACLLHYGACNESISPATDSVLLDFGVNYHGYVSDVARVYGLKQEPHQAIYEVLYKVQSSILQMLVENIEKKSGAKEKMSLNSLHRMMQVMLLAELKRLGFADGNYEKLLNILAVAVPHHIGHFIASYEIYGNWV